MSYVSITQIHKPGGFTNAAGTVNFLRAIDTLTVRVDWETMQIGGLNLANIEMVDPFEDTTDFVAGNWVYFALMGGTLSASAAAGTSSVTVTGLGDSTFSTSQQDLRANDYVLISNGSNTDLMKVASVSGSGPWTVNLTSAPGQGTTTLLNAYAVGTTIARLQFSGYLMARNTRTTNLNGKYVLQVQGFASRYNSVLCNADIVQQDCATSIYNLCNSYAPTLPQMIVSSGNFASANSFLCTTQSTNTPVLKVLTDIIKTENSQNANVNYALWVDQVRQVHHATIPGANTATPTGNVGDPGSSHATPTYTIDIANPQTSSSYGDSIGPLDATDMDLSQMVNTALVFGGQNASTKQPISIIVQDQTSQNAWGYWEGQLTNTNITDETTLANWGAGQLCISAYPRTTAKTTFIYASARLTCWDLLQVQGFTDSTVMQFNPTRIKYIADHKSRIITGDMDLSQARPDIGAIMTAGQNQISIRNLNTKPPTNLDKMFVVSGFDLTISGLNVTIAAGVISYNGTLYNIPQYTYTLPSNGPTLFGGQVAGSAGVSLPSVVVMPSVVALSTLYANNLYSVTRPTSMGSPITITASTNFVGIPLWRVWTANGAVAGKLDQRVWGGVTTQNTIQMPASIKASGPTITSSSVTSRSLVAGLFQPFTATFTTSDWGSSVGKPSWLHSIVMYIRVNGNTGAPGSRLVDPGTFSSQTTSTTTFSALATLGAAGTTIDVGFSYKDLYGQESAIVWPSATSAVADPSGPIFDPTGDPTGGILHARAPLPIRTRIGPDKTLYVDGTTGPVSGQLPVLNHDPSIQGLQMRNLLQNGNFYQNGVFCEAASNGWLLYNSVGMASHRGAGTYTVNGVTFTSESVVTTTGSGCGLYQVVNVKPGATYSYCALSYNSAANGTSQVWIGATNFSASYNTPGRDSAPFGSPGSFYSAAASRLPGANTQGPGWVLLSGTFTIPNNVSQVAFLLESTGNSGVALTDYWLGAMFYEGSKYQDYVDGEAPGVSFGVLDRRHEWVGNNQGGGANHIYNTRGDNNLAGWSSYSTGGSGWVFQQSPYFGGSFHIYNSASTSGQNVLLQQYIGGSGVGGFGGLLMGGETYTVSCRIQNNGTGSAFLQTQTASGVQTNSNSIGPGQCGLASVTITLASGDNGCYVKLNTSTSTGTTDVYFYDPQFEMSAVPTAYRDHYMTRLVANVFDTNSQAQHSTFLNKQGSLLNMQGTPVFTYSGTSSTITISIPQSTYKFTDNTTTVTVPSASDNRTGLVSTNTYHWNIFYDIASNTFGFTFYGMSAPTNAQTFQDCYRDGRVPVYVNYSTTPQSASSGGTAGGGSGGTGSTCPADYQEVFVRDRGWVRADEVDVGDYFPRFGGGWVRVDDAVRIAAPIWRYVFECDGITESLDVCDTHLSMGLDGEWLMVRDMKPGDKLLGENGKTIVVKEAFFVKDGHYIGFCVEGHEWAWGGQLVHNLNTM